MPLIHHVATGAGSPPIVFVHGFACGHTDWDAQVAHLSPRHQAVAVDLRGHGESTGSPADCSIERYGADVAEVMRALTLPPAVLVGHSMGCRVVIEAALQAPTHTAAVVLVDGSQFAAAMGSVLQAAFGQPNGYQTLTQSMFKDMFVASSDPAIAAGVIERAGRLSRAVGERMLLDLYRYDIHRLNASLGSLRVPVLAIQATYANERRERTSMTAGQTSPYLDRLRATVPDIRIAVVENAGHFPQLDAPAKTNAILDEFIATLPRH